MESITTEEYRGYTIQILKSGPKDIIKIYLGDELMDYEAEKDEPYEGSEKKEGLEGAKQYIDELEEKENSL